MKLEVIVRIVMLIATIVGYYKLYEKMGRNGWEALIPIYNIYVLNTYVQKRNPWLVLLILVPFVNVVYGIILLHTIVKGFGKTWVYTLLIAILPVLILILAFNENDHYDENRALENC